MKTPGRDLSGGCTDIDIGEFVGLLKLTDIHGTGEAELSEVVAPPAANFAPFVQGTSVGVANGKRCHRRIPEGDIAGLPDVLTNPDVEVSGLT